MNIKKSVIFLFIQKELETKSTRSSSRIINQRRRLHTHDFPQFQVEMFDQGDSRDLDRWDDKHASDPFGLLSELRQFCHLVKCGYLSKKKFVSSLVSFNPLYLVKNII